MRVSIGTCLTAVCLLIACGDDQGATGGPGRHDGGADATADGSSDRPGDAPADAAADAAVDGVADVTADAATDASVDRFVDAEADAAAGDGPPAPATCPAQAAPVDVCGCGCCGQPMGRACWYPARGESAAGIPDPRPANCATVGCSAGVRHLCCADPGPAAGNPGSYCARDLATALERYAIVRRDGASCVQVVVARVNQPGALPVAAPPGWSVRGERGPCDQPGAREPAIGALGTFAVDGAFQNMRFDLHAALFFGDASGVAQAIRLDVDDLALSPGCGP